MSSPTSKAFALKFISGKYQGGEFPLKNDKEIVIGRSSELDMVLVEDMVSRKHAKIVIQAGKVTIADLGSTNGTFVNGEKIKQARLKEGDRILIGTSILKLVGQEAGAKQLDDKEIKDRMEQVAAQKPKSSGAMSGRIEEVPLPDLLQLFQTSKKNGVLIVNNGQSEGRIFLRGGKVYYAVIDNDHELGPQKSFYRLITWDKGSFELGPPDGQEFMIELEESTEALLMEALRQLDELRRIEKSLPPRSATLQVAMPLEAPLRELKPEQLDVLQLVHNYGSTALVLDKSDATDLETPTALNELIQKGYVKKT